MNKQPQPIETMAVLALAAALLYIYSGNVYLLYACVFLLFTGIFLKPVSAFIHKGWMALAHLLGKINGYILLSILFMVILTPIALVHRLFHKDNLKLKKQASGSYFTARNHLYSSKDLEKTW